MVNHRMRSRAFRDHFVRPIEKEALDRPCLAFAKLEPTFFVSDSVVFAQCIRPRPKQRLQPMRQKHHCKSGDYALKGCRECADLCDFSDALTVVARSLSLLVSRLSVLVVYLGPGLCFSLHEWAASLLS